MDRWTSSYVYEMVKYTYIGLFKKGISMARDEIINKI